MSMEKINDFVDCWAKAINVPVEYANIVKEVIPYLIQKYSSSFPNGITVNQDPYDKYVIKPTNGVYSLEDFFLNRLLRNVWSFQKDSKYKGDYQPSDMSIHFNEEKIRNQLNKVLDTKRSDFNQLKKDAARKVKMHEFEHAFQTRYSNECLDIRYRMAYKNIIDEIRNYKGGKYETITYSYEELKNKNPYANFDKYLSTGFHFSSNNKSIKTYREVKGFDELNEIFNETESLDSAKTTKQGYIQYRDGSYMVVRNAESSNYSITEYGYLLKIILGNQISFIGMYLNPSVVIQIFNETHKDIFKDSFKNNKDPWENLLNQLYKIKQTNDQKEHLFLQEVLAKCMSQKIEKGLITNVDENIMSDALENFKDHCIWGQTREIRESLAHFRILKNSKDKIELQKNKKR